MKKRMIQGNRNKISIILLALLTIAAFAFYTHVQALSLDAMSDSLFKLGPLLSDKSKDAPQDMEFGGVMDNDTVNNLNEKSFSALIMPKSLVVSQMTGFIWPLQGELRSGFGYRQHPMGGGTRFHRGIDIAAPKGTTIYSALEGQVVSAGRNGLLGKCVILKHGNDFSTYYAHCSLLLVEVGQKIAKGQAIAEVGSTGLSTGPHLHFEIRQNNVPIDPLKFIHPY